VGKKPSARARKKPAARARKKPNAREAAPATGGAKRRAARKAPARKPSSPVRKRSASARKRSTSGRKRSASARKPSPSARKQRPATGPRKRPARPTTSRAGHEPVEPKKTARKRSATRSPRGVSASAARGAPASTGRTTPRERIAAGIPIEVGVVTHWYGRVSAAVVRLSHPIHRGDTIHVRGPLTDLVQQVESLALGGATVNEGLPGQELGVQLGARARQGDRVYRVSW